MYSRTDSLAEFLTMLIIKFLSSGHACWQTHWSVQFWLIIKIRDFVKNFVCFTQSADGGFIGFCYRRRKQTNRFKTHLNKKLQILLRWASSVFCGGKMRSFWQEKNPIEFIKNFVINNHNGSQVAYLASFSKCFFCDVMTGCSWQHFLERLWYSLEIMFKT